MNASRKISRVLIARSGLAVRAAMQDSQEKLDELLSIRLAGRPTVYCLDETGKRRNKLPAEFDGKCVRLRTDNARSPWIEIEVPKPSP